MAKFLHPDLLRSAAARLGASRASKSFLHFLIFKRTMVSSGESVVSFSVNNADLLTAVDELGACARGNARLGSRLTATPFVGQVSVAVPSSQVAHEWHRTSHLWRGMANCGGSG
jgi:hypothetical protein